MSNSKCETASHFAAILSLLMLVLNLYLSFFFVPDILGPDLSIQGFPLDNGIRQFDLQNIEFTFLLKINFYDFWFNQT